MQLNEKLARHRIAVRLSTRVNRPTTPLSPDAQREFAALGLIAGDTVLTTTRGDPIRTDLQFWTTGAVGANTSFLAHVCPEAIDATTSRLRVNEFGQAFGCRNVFAAGDVALLPVPEQQLAFYAGLQGQVRRVPFSIIGVAKKVSWGLSARE